MTTYPSIFNDVIGPVMRGPSSSHCAASLLIARLCRDLMGGRIDNILIEFDPNGSLATTHKDQGSDMGLFGGFLGWDADDERLPESEKHIADAGISVSIEIVDIGAAHPNTYKITLSNSVETRRLTAISTGGGMIEVTEIDGAPVSMAGDYFETLIYTTSPEEVRKLVMDRIRHEYVEVHAGEMGFVEIKSREFPAAEIVDELLARLDVMFIRKLEPVLPVLARRELFVPFESCEEMLAFNDGKDFSLWELAAEYESARGGISKAEVFEKMRAIVQIMGSAIKTGLKGTEYSDRILGSQSLQMREQLDSRNLIGGDANNTIIMYVSATMEVKSSMGVVVAAPTAGSCGALPGAVFGVAESLDLSEDDVVKAMLAAGIIGVFIASRATFAAEVGGCMAETGSGGGMAAAAIAMMAGGTLSQSIGAASLALQNSLGLICDPIGNRVEAPCLGRNVMAATNAVACANMALSNYEHLIPLDEVIDTMKEVGDRIHNTLRCTNLGGLSITSTAKKIGETLSEQQAFFKSC
ncbi:MAG TPA: L-serine ammonia-lyase, iron-sulfur-dependent, subunit alpha [Pyrinomonadaceae bacterium]|nr:L-serine ammonia-lyase, iron-sulfur-dependent, subunit alpha [Acidobacteriota bacterium]HQZ95987.1 L-serine ammonia-lyase, iron-sulfur-dependent, subunit alpha [Pyrinomonadaceae bacterium]